MRLTGSSHTIVTHGRSDAGTSSVSGVSTGATCGAAMPPIVPPDSANRGTGTPARRGSPRPAWSGASAAPSDLGAGPTPRAARPPSGEQDAVVDSIGEHPVQRE